MEKSYDDLLAWMRKADKVLVAFSGGVDSSLLLQAACEALGNAALGVTIRSPLHPTAETTEAEAQAAAMHARHMIVDLDELTVPEIRENSPERCYHCKRFRFGKLIAMARDLGYDTIVEGSNRDDESDYRPGMRAVRELGLRSPFLDLDWTKADIRAAAQARRLDTWNRPAAACLASRLPYGTEITRERLDRVRQAEGALAALGFQLFRVRDHGPLARIEVTRDEFSRLMAHDNRRRVIRALKRLGYTYVALDLEGYRTGAMNETLPGRD